MNFKSPRWKYDYRYGVLKKLLFPQNALGVASVQIPAILIYPKKFHALIEIVAEWEASLVILVFFEATHGHESSTAITAGIERMVNRS